MWPEMKEQKHKQTSKAKEGYLSILRKTFLEFVFSFKMVYNNHGKCHRGHQNLVPTYGLEITEKLHVKFPCMYTQV